MLTLTSPARMCVALACDVVSLLSSNGGDKVLFNVDTDFVAKCKTPLLVLMGDDLYHPQSSSRLVADVAPDVEFIEYWKEGEDRNAAMDAFAGFLARNAI